jgi:hypothetical protein
MQPCGAVGVEVISYGLANGAMPAPVAVADRLSAHPH